MPRTVIGREQDFQGDTYGQCGSCGLVVRKRGTSQADVHRHLRVFIGAAADSILRLGRLAYNLLVEEYPASIRYITQGDDENTWIFNSYVLCNYAGIGRFAIGLSDDIDILEDDGLKK